MKLTVLLDNCVFNDERYLRAEAAVSYYIEADGKTILFDVGYSDVYITNAQRLHIDLLKLDYLVFSHAHLDHTWGLSPLLAKYSEGSKEGAEMRIPKVVVNPGVFRYRPRKYLGGSNGLVGEDRLSCFFEIQKFVQPVWLTERLVFLTGIPKSNDFELKKPFLKVRNGTEDVDDYMEDEVALAYKSKEGLVVISTCSHRGICNIMDYAKSVCNETRIADVVGGFHLINPKKELLDNTVKYFIECHPANVHACHCTDFQSKIALSGVVNLKEVGVGLALEYEY